MSLKTIPLALNGKPRCFTHNSPSTTFNLCNSPKPEDAIAQQHQEAVGDDPFYQSLQQYSCLYRIVLQRPVVADVTLNQWHRADLELVNELGMVLTGSQIHVCQIRLTCELLVLGPGGVVRDLDHKVETRPLPFDAWEANDNSISALDYPGFQSSSAGGLEFRITSVTREDPITSYQSTARTWYLRILPTFESTQTTHALPLVVAIRLSSPNYAFAKQRDEARWGKHAGTGDMHRAFECGDITDRFFIIKEGWKLGTPGKMWDSALVLSDMFSRRITSDPACLDGRHIIDLSAGTGCAGLLFAYLYHHLFPQYQPLVSLTDLPEALPLIHHNKAINLGHDPDWLSIKRLQWGNVSDAKLVLRPAPADIILASDVLYEPASFGLLVESLVSLSTPGRTVIYLGYKRRGLQDEDEANFFRLCAANFHIDLVQCDEGHRNPIEWERTFGFMKRLPSTLDGRGWLGSHPEVCDASLALKTSVRIYRLVRKVN